MRPSSIFPVRARGARRLEGSWRAAPPAHKILLATIAIFLSVFLTSCLAARPGGRPGPLPPSPQSPEEYVAWYRNAAKLGSDHRLTEVRSGPSALTGRTYHRYEHRYRGWLVAGDVLTLRSFDGVVERSWARIRTDMPKLEPVDADRLLAAAKAAFEARVSPTSPVQYHPTDPARCAAVILADVRDPVFIYRCILRTVSPGRNYSVAVRVSDGSLVFARPLEFDAWLPVSIEAESTLHGRVGPFAAEQSSLPDHECWLRSEHFEVFDAEGRDIQNVPAIQWLKKEIISEPNCQFQSLLSKDAVTVHWGVQEAADTYHEIFSTRPLTDPMPPGTEPFLPGGRLESYVNVGDDNATYFWPSRVLLFGHRPQNLAELSVVGHEMGHAIAHARLGEEYLNVVSPTYRAFEEGWCDFLGILTESRPPRKTDWRVHFARNLLDPLSEGRPDVYQGVHWSGTSPHTNSAPLTRWLSLLALGGSGTNSNGNPYEVQSLGYDHWQTSMALPARVLGAALFEILGTSATYPEVRQVTQGLAHDFCGSLSLLSKSVHEAWFAVGLESQAWPTVATLPADEAIDVQPWPVRFAWPVDPSDPLPGVSWTLEVASDLRFDDTASHHVPGTSIETIAGVDHHVLSLMLRPDKHYAWRVRPNHPEPFRCWRSPQTFSTAANIPKPVSPSQDIYHPWELPFELDIPAGTEFVRIEVGYDPNFASPTSLAFTPKSFPAGEEEKATRQAFELTVPKGQNKLFWRARAYRSGHSTSRFSQSRRFATNDPIVELIGPQYDGIYPWKVEFRWKPLKGATMYEGEVQYQRYKSGAFASFRAHGDTSLARRSFHAPARPPEDSQLYWHAAAIGPPLGSALAPEPETTKERSRTSLDMKFSINREATRVQYIAPNLTNPGACHAVDEPLWVRWQGVHEETATELRIFHDTGPGTFQNAPLFEEILPQHRVASTVDVPVVLRPSWDSSGALRRSFRVELRARGPKPIDYVGGSTSEYTTGHEADATAIEGFYRLASATPIPVDPGTVSVPWGTDMIRMAWTTMHVPTGSFVGEIYEGPGCTGQPEGFAVFTGGHHQGLYAYQSQGVAGTTYSWRVRPSDDPECNHAPWSACTDFVVGESLPELEAPTAVSLGTGTVQRVFVLFSVVPEATSYEIQVREQSPSGPVVFNERIGTVVLWNHKNEVAAEVGATQPFLPNFLFAIIGNAVPIRAYYFKVRACRGPGECSNWSNWAEWIETIGFPW